MNFLKCVSGWDSWYEHQDRKAVATAALDDMALWSKAGVTPAAVREMCAGEGHPGMSMTSLGRWEITPWQ